MFGSIFDEEWRACLRAHYFHVIKERDTNNERSLETVLIQTGFTPDDLTAMRAEIYALLGWEPESVEQPEQSLEDAAYLIDDEAELPAEITVPEEFGSLDALIESPDAEGVPTEEPEMMIAETPGEYHTPDLSQESQVAEDLIEVAVHSQVTESESDPEVVGSIDELAAALEENVSLETIEELPVTESLPEEAPKPAETPDEPKKVWTLPPKKTDKKKDKKPPDEKPNQMSLF